MIHTDQAMEVMEKCDFSEESYRWVEKLCLEHTAKQIVQLVWSKDPGGIRDWDWFAPFFDRGYVPKINHIEVNIGENFWEAYEIIAGFVQSFSVFDMPLIGEMSEDTSSMRVALERSKPNVKYVYKVWQDVRPKGMIYIKPNPIKIGNSGVRTIGFT